MGSVQHAHSGPSFSGLGQFELAWTGHVIGGCVITREREREQTDFLGDFTSVCLAAYFCAQPVPCVMNVDADVLTQLVLGRRLCHVCVCAFSE